MLPLPYFFLQLDGDYRLLRIWYHLWIYSVAVYHPRQQACSAPCKPLAKGSSIADPACCSCSRNCPCWSQSFCKNCTSKPRALPGRSFNLETNLICWFPWILGLPHYKIKKLWSQTQPWLSATETNQQEFVSSSRGWEIIGNKDGFGFLSPVDLGFLRLFYMVLCD